MVKYVRIVKIAWIVEIDIPFVPLTLHLRPYTLDLILFPCQRVPCALSREPF
jgi:hypothetical protein